MDELPLIIVKMQVAKDKVIARVKHFLICKAAFEKALFVYPDAHLELRQGASLLWGVLVTALVASGIVLLATVNDAHLGFLVSGFHPVRPLGLALVGRRKLAVV
jgi:hypothetical protein